MRALFGIRTATLTLVVGSILLTSAILIAVAYHFTRQAEVRLQHAVFATIKQSIAEQARLQFSPGVSLLGELADRAQRDLLPIGDHETLGRYLGERLRHQPHLAWISWADATDGRFVGVRRTEDGHVVLNRSDPSRRQGKPEEYLISNGALVPIDANYPEYDPRSRDWFALASARTTVVWTSTFTFNEGRRGVTIAQAVRDPEGRVRGVLTVDLFIEHVAAFLSSLHSGDSGFSFVVHEDGAVILPSPPTGASATQSSDSIRALWRERRLDHDKTTRVTIQGETHLLALRQSPVAGEMGWYCGVLMPERALAPGLRDAMRRAIAAAALVVALVTGFSGFLATRLAASLRALAAELQEISKGHTRVAPHDESSRLEEVEILRGAVMQLREALRAKKDLLREIGQVEQASKIKSDVLAMVAHDLRSPLQVIKGHAGLLREQEGDAEESWTAIERATESMERLVGNMLELSRLEAGKLPISAQRISVDEILQRAHSSILLQARSKGLAIRFARSSSHLEIKSDPNRLEQILVNLLSNAVKYTDRGWVELDCRIVNGDVEFQVSDTGPGMSPNEINHAFEPFQRGSAGIGRKDSHGLGLAICEKLTQRLGGTLRVESEPGKGTRFVLRLPVEIPGGATQHGVN
jgi:signal transduction histidine kinase